METGTFITLGIGEYAESEAQPVGSDAELALTETISAYELKAGAFAIRSDGDYGAAAEFGRSLKRVSSEVAAFFKPMKEAANRAHKEVCEREKAMLKPLLNAEKVLKDAMGAYALRKEQERKAIEEAARLTALEEAERKLAEAVDAAATGDAAAAESAMQDAQVAESMSRMLVVAADAPKAEGVSASKDWEITMIDDAAVPVEHSGSVLRPVDEKAVLRLIRASKGTIEIPGVEYRETAKISIRK